MTTEVTTPQSVTAMMKMTKAMHVDAEPEEVLSVVGKP